MHNIAIYEGLKYCRILIFLVCQCWYNATYWFKYIVAILESMQNKQSVWNWVKSAVSISGVRVYVNVVLQMLLSEYVFNTKKNESLVQEKYFNRDNSTWVHQV